MVIIGGTRAARLSGRAHLARHSVDVGKSSLGSAPAGAQSYWQGRFAACALVGDFLGVERPKNCWGVAPNPTRGAASGLRKGQLPLDPFARLSWSHSHNSSACCSPILLPPLPQVPAASPANPHNPSQSAHSDRAASFLPPPAIHTASAPRRRAGQCWSRSCRPADDRR